MCDQESMSNGTQTEFNKDSVVFASDSDICCYAHFLVAVTSLV